MLEQVLKTIARFRMISPGQRIAVACSGGPDSTALLLILQELSRRLGCTLSVCHLNHRLRGEESDKDARFVQELADRLSVPLHIQQADVQGSARATHSNLEAKARELRYGFFRSLVAANKADRIAVGHTADDQAETVIHRLLRGAGTRGLAGIYPVVDDQIVRPLIETRRSTLIEWLQARQQPWREDLSNRDLRLTRNRIRHQLLPALSEFNPRIMETLGDTAEIARDEEAFWRDYLPVILSRTAKTEKEKVLIDIERLREAPPAAARRVLRWAIGRVAASSCASLPIHEIGDDGFQTSRFRFESIDFKHIQRIVHLAYDGTSGSAISLPQKIGVRKEFSHLIFEKAESPLGEFQGFSFRIRAPGTVEVPEIGSSFCFELVPFSPGQPRYNRKGSPLLDLRLAAISLTLRNWRPGDGYIPKGHRRRKKLKELSQRNRISASEREGWPVVLADNEIVWARGLEVAEAFYPNPGSTQAILIEERRH